MTNIDFLYNKEAAKKYFGDYSGRNHFEKKKLNFRVIEQGTILSHVLSDSSWWGLGGIIDNQGNFVNGSSTIGGQGGIYNMSAEVRKNSETVVFLGLFAPAWGHDITVNLQKLWFLDSEVFKTSFKNCRIVFMPWKHAVGEGYHYIYQKKSFQRVLEILGIDPDSLYPIIRPTQFERIILPDNSFYTKDSRIFFTQEYRDTIEQLRNFAQKNKTPTPSKKVYYFYGRHQIGEERLAEYLKSKGYLVVSPEKLTFDEQLNLLINCDSFASTLGSCSHNSIFLRDNTDVLFIPRAANRFTGYQQALDQVHDLNINYVDSSMSLFGGIHGPNCLIISEQLKRLFGDKFDGYAEDDFKIFLEYVNVCRKNNIGIIPKSKEIYGKGFSDFLEQLKKRKDLLSAYKWTLDEALGIL